MSTAQARPDAPRLRREGVCFPRPKYFNTREVTGRGGDWRQTCSTFTFPSDWTPDQDR